MRTSLLTQFARALGLVRPAPAPPFGGVWFEAPPPPAHDHRARPLARRSFSEAQKAAVWQKGQPMIGWDPSDWRVDHHGNPIFRQHYRDSGSAFGWEVGRIVVDGGDDLANLRPQICHVPQPEPAGFTRTLDLDPFAR